MSGASGVIYGIRLLEVLKAEERIETHLVMSDSAKMNIGLETDWSANDVKGLADHVHSNKDIAASIASGSFQTAGMIVAPCAIKTFWPLPAGQPANKQIKNLLWRWARPLPCFK